ncbi:2-oxoacid:acceptor oxidoreductase subunit alpha [Candidatus Gottesmanbacteria bacterium]|nr:2-oxoacid:acceptor oxidoreductase subunit alpha [Candidatus Gottesmanbacteria bacterium]
MNYKTWKIGGEAGFGIMVSGLTLSKALARSGFHIIEINEYPSLIRGGHNTVSITFSPDELSAQYKPVDVLVALNKQTIEYHREELGGGAIVIYDGSQYEIEKTPESANFLSVPLLTLAKSVGGDLIMRNTVALGVSMAILGIDFEILSNILTSQFAKKGEKVTTLNVSAARKGYDYIFSNFKEFASKKEAPKQTQKQMVVTGAEAVGLGAISAGMKFFAAYPMTPINAILNLMASIQEKMGIVYKQPEDEIAGINMAIGASFAGVRSMVATSGGGFSLMVEGTSLAGMIEQPIVIVMGMRPGPATGLPTWTGQADLHFVLNASQGEFPRLVVAPGDAQEAFYLTSVAFNLADTYQTPTFVLVDKYLCETRYSTPIFEASKVSIDRGKIATEREQGKEIEFPRYTFTEDGISPRGIPGRKKGVFRANSDEHNEYGYSEESAENTRKMIEKRMKKQMAADKIAPDPVIYGEKDADVTVIGWGSTKGAALEAIKNFKEEGKISVNYVQLNYVNPFPTVAVSRILGNCKRVIDVEGNHNGQMADLIRMKTGYEIKNKILKYDGRPFYPEDIIEGLKKYV